MSEGPKRPYKSNIWFDYHQTSSHSTGDYKVVLAQACKMRSAWDNKSESEKKKAYRGHTNSNKINVLVQKEIEKQLKAVKTADTKCKNKKGKSFLQDDEHLDNIEEFELLKLSESKDKN